MQWCALKTKGCSNAVIGKLTRGHCTLDCKLAALSIILNFAPSIEFSAKQSSNRVLPAKSGFSGASF
uniref:Transposase n=1 Tax=Mesocestoides corti TaxID=53468 RepID=A0A5K3FGP8_MESCO